MPVRKVQGGYRWGNSGKVYPTKAQAERQGRAIYASGYQDGGIIDVTQGDDPSIADRTRNFMGATMTDRFGLPVTTDWERPETPMLTPAQTTYLASQIAPGAGYADFEGSMPAMPGPDVPIEQAFSGEPMPGFVENVRTGHPVIAGLQALGLAGDVVPALKSAAVLKGIAALKGLSMFPMSGMTAWHGSPHRFDQFRSSQIGTGEGAQAFGHGLYFAENPKTARTYSADRSYVGRAMAGDADSAEWDAARIAQTAMDEFDDEAVDHLRNVLRQRSTAPHQIVENKKIQDAIGMIQRGQVTRAGVLYEVDIPDEAIAKMLDWDAPISEQSEHIQKFFSDAGLHDLEGQIKLTRVNDELAEIAEATSKAGWIDRLKLERRANQLAVERRNLTANLEQEGSVAYSRLARKEGGYPPHDVRRDRPAASAALNEAGIPGIRYFDAGSRGAGEGTRNFVVFDENLPKILGME